MQLPIEDYKEEIQRAVTDNDVVIITAETGAGKTTQVPQYLYESGFEVVVTQPRRVAARTAAMRVAEEMETSLGGLVGFRTAEEKYSSAETKVLFCTDGLQLVRELTGNGAKDDVILIIDEVHEWNRNIETLIAWAKHQLGIGVALKVVIMSATLEAEKLSAYYNDAPVISVPGRLFPVEAKGTDDDPAMIAADLARAGRNVLVFSEGKAEIAGLVDVLKAMELYAEILPLHGALTPAEQKKAFLHYGRSKIVVATNVAQTSITIDDIDAVVDNGIEKKIEVRDGIEGLFIADTSQADCEQRKGRAGRTKEGIYVLCSRVKLEDREKFPVPEILRSRLDQLVLRLAVIGLDATELEFFHQPDHDEIARAKQTLIKLGAMTEDMQVTGVGRAMSHLPVDVRFARMLVEAERRGAIDDVIVIVSCLEAGSLRGRGKKDEEGREMIPGWRSLTREHESDLLTELDLYNAAREMTKKEMWEHDIPSKTFAKAKEIRDRLAGMFTSPERPASSRREEIMKAITAGMVEHVYMQTYDNYVGSEGDVRQRDRKSVVFGESLIAGVPFNLEIKTREGNPLTLQLITSVTKVEMAWLQEVAPQLLEEKPRGYEYVPHLGDVALVTDRLFNGLGLDSSYEPAKECPEATRALAEALVKGRLPYPDRVHNETVVREVNKIATRHNELETLTEGRLIEIFIERLGKTYQVKDLEARSLSFRKKVNLKLDVEGFVPVELIPDLKTEVIEYDGTSFTVSYEEYYSRISATVVISQADMDKVRILPLLPKADEVTSVQIVGENGEVVARGYNLRDAQDSLENYEARLRRESEERKLQEEVNQLRKKAGELADRGLPTDYLNQLISKARMPQGYRYFGATNAAVHDAIRTAENEIVRLESASPQEILLEELMAGKIHHPDLTFNRGILAELDSHAIRSAGFIESLSEDQLREHYAKRLEENGITMLDQLLEADLKLRLEDYAPADILAELEMAPCELELTGRKGTSAYPISYRYDDLDGMRTPIGMVRIPVATYEKNCESVGRRSGFSQLPHGITLIIEVTEKNKVIASGEDSEQLQAQIKRYKKGKKRSPNQHGVLSHEGTAPPPWHVGNVRY